MAEVYEYENIYKGGKSLLIPGRLRIASSGLGFKASSSGKITTVPAGDIRKAQFLRGSKGHMLRISLNNGDIVKFDGFQSEVDQNGNFTSGGHLDEIRRLFRGWRVEVEMKETNVRGWNWGQTDFAGNSLWFNAGNKPVMEIPLSAVSGTTMNGKTEVTIEIKPPTEDELELAGKEGARSDQLVEARFYIPDMVVQGGRPSAADAEGGDNQEEDDEENMEVDQNQDQDSAANIFYETVKAKADVGQLVGEPLALIEDVPFITPRGRYNMDLYEDSIRLHGKSHNYRIPYLSIKSLFALTRPDDIHEFIVIGMDPPLRQGQTRYPFLVIQCVKDVDLEIELNLDALSGDAQSAAMIQQQKEDLLRTKFGGRLRLKYDAEMYQVLGALLSGFSGIDLTKAGMFKSHFSNPCVKCSIKANEGYLYLLQTEGLFLPKPTHHFRYEEVSHIVFSRVGSDSSSSSTANKTFDMKVFLRNTAGLTLPFSGLEREEYDKLVSHFKAVGIKVRTEVSVEQVAITALDGLSSDDDDDAGAGMIESDNEKAGGMNGMDMDSDEDDEDFVAGEESDVAEEFDENYESDEDEEDAEDGGEQ
ncbi:hypothetical protein MP228_009300 [Amoeboaphelidium protococcarum]|nr:hypothetical protein MP228_009300 [Amoeboaphelidium protococcarum]